MSYWLGKHSLGETPLGIASKHQVAVSPEPEGATYGWLVECRCGWQARVVRATHLSILQLQSVLEGTAQNHFDRHLLESINKEIIWPSFLSPSPESQEPQPPTQEQPSVVPSVVQPVQQLVTKPEKPLVVPSQVATPKKAVSPSPQPSTTLLTPVVKTPNTQSPSTDSQATSSAATQATTLVTQDQAPPIPAQAPTPPQGDVK